MTASLFGDLDTPQHTRDFSNPILLGQLIDAGKSASFLDFFLHDKVTVRHGGDLRQVRDADHLMVHRHLLELFADDFSEPSTHSRVHFIEEQRRDHTRASEPKT